MGRMSTKPWYRKQTGYYYCQINGRQVKLDKDKDVAKQMWHELMAGKKESEVTGITLVKLANSYLSHQQNTKSEITVENCMRWIPSFVDFCEEHFEKDIKAANVTPKMVLCWLYGRDAADNEIRTVNKQRRRKKQTLYKTTGAFKRPIEDLSQNSLVAALRIISALFNYGVKTKEFRGDNPVEAIPDKPTYTPREVVISNEEWTRVIDSIPAESPFRDLVQFMRETGCRPGEARAIEMKHFKPDTGTLKFASTERGKKKDRQILLSTEALKIFQKWALKYPKGPIFRNRDGNPWSNGAIVRGFGRIRERTGVVLTAYTLRHTFCTNALLAGVSRYDVSQLMGHTNTKMVERVYSHLNLGTDKRFRASAEKIHQAQNAEKPEDLYEDDDNENPETIKFRKDA